MTIQEDLLLILRADLGEGHEQESLPLLYQAYAVKGMRRHLIALYKSRIDMSIVESARQAVELALADEETQRKSIEEAVPAQVDADLAQFGGS